MIEIKEVRVKVSWARSQAKSKEEKIIKRIIESKEISPEPDAIESPVVPDEQESKKAKTSKIPPPPPSSQNRPDYLSRHIGQLSNLK